MAITARFQADFTSFYDAVNKAEVELKSFEQGAGKVEKSLNRMVDSFSGRRVIQEATLMAQAVEKIGGTSKLTEAELIRLGKQAEIAIEKMKAIGVEVPANLRKVADEAKIASERLKGITAPDGLSKIEGAAGSAATGIGGLVRSVGPLAGAFAGAFAISTVTGFAKEIIDLGGHLVDLSDKTGISVDGLQVLQAAAELSGNSLEQVTGAVSQMQNRLASGDNSAVSAIKSLGLSLSDLQAMQPDQQFRAIARSIAEIQDPAERTRVAIDLFGRAGADLLPTLVSDIDSVAESTVRMSDRSARALDAAGDAWTRFVGGVKNRTGELLADIIDTVTTMDGLKETMMRLSGNQAGAAISLEFRKAKDEATAMAKALKIPAKDIAEPFKVGTAAIDEFLKKGDKIPTSVGKSLKDIAKSAADTVQPLKNASIFTRDIADSMKYLAVVQPPVVTGAQAFRNELAGVNNNGTLVNDMLPQMKIRLQDVGQKGFKQAEKDAKSFADFLQNDLGKIITSAFTGGGDIGKSIGSAIGGFLTSANGFIGQAVGKLGGTLGKVLGSIVPGLGSLLGGVLGGGLDKLFGKLFKTEEKQVNDLRDKFQSTFGAGETGFNKMAAAAQRAGYDIKKLLDAKTVKDYQREIENLNDALRFQDDAMKTLDDTVAKYGFSLEELGPAFARQKLDEQAQGLWKDFQVLTGAGVDVNTVLGKMGGSINEFVQQALKTGTEIPIAMAPMLQKMVEMGQLTDENGNVITNLEDAGVTFAMTMTEGFQSLIGEVKKLTDAIARGLGLSLDNVTKKINDIPDVTVNVDANIDPRLNGLLDPNRDIVIDPPSGPTYASTGGRITDRGIQYFAGGGNVLPFRPRGTDTVPAMLTPGETVRTAQQEAAIQQALGSNTNTEILQVLSEIRALLEQGRNVSVQVDGRELVKAEMKALDRGGDLLTNYRDLLGVA